MLTCSVVLPTFNEVQTAPSIVSSLLGFDRVVEVIVVDDDSPDGTAAEIAERYPLDERVAVIRRTDESGLSSAVLRGFAAASSDALVCMDADGQHPPEMAARLAMAIEDGADLAVGSRHVDTGSVAAEWPLHRRAISWGATALAWAAVPPARNVADPMSGLFAVRSELVGAAPDLRPHGYKILLELLGRCPLEDVREVGFTFRERERGASNLGIREYAKYVRHLRTLIAPSRRRYYGNRLPVRDVEDSDA